MLPEEKSRKLKPWVVDAADLAFDQVEVFNAKLLHMTREITDFLDPHGDKLLVVAPRGLGKTLLLKAKRISLQPSADHPGGIKLYPYNDLVDKVAAIPQAVSEEKLHNMFLKYSYWRQVWLIAITFGCALYLRLDNGRPLPPISSAGLNRIAKSKDQKTIASIFNQVLSFTDSDYHRAVSDYNNELEPYFKNIKQQIATFIDNIDELFSHPVSATTTSNGASLQGTGDRRVWVYAQVALARAIRDLHNLNKHVKIYASIRSEAFAALPHDEENGMQLAGSAIEVKYSKKDLYDIFCNNIALMDPKQLASPSETEPVLRLVGSTNAYLPHIHTGREEEFFDFVLRHTLYRPRDLMAFGARISGLEKSERDAKTLKDTIHDAGAKLAHQYFGEVRPFVGLVREDRLLRLIPANVLSPSQVAEIAAEFKKVNDGTDTEHPFCALYKAGLLGSPRSSSVGEIIQEFANPGSIRLDEDEILPKTNHYIIHPSLDEVIYRKNSEQYQRNYNQQNIIGQRLPWRNTIEIRYACKGDVVRFSEVMRHPEYSRSFPGWFRDTVIELTRDLDFADVMEGDSVLLIGRNPRRLVRVMRLISQALASHPMARKIRFAASDGPIDLVEARDRGGLPGFQNKAPLGQALRTSARLEPHAPHGHVLCTPKFAAEAKKQGARKAERAEVPTLDFDSDVEKFIVTKKGTGYDSEERMELWLIDLGMAEQP